MRKALKEITDQQWRPILVIILGLGGVGLFLEIVNGYVFYYTIALIFGSWSALSKPITDSGKPIQEKLLLSAELNVLILAAALFFVLRSIIPEIYKVDISNANQAYFVVSICGYIFIYFSVINKNKGIIRGSWAKFLKWSYFIILVMIPLVYFFHLVFF